MAAMDWSRLARAIGVRPGEGRLVGGVATLFALLEGARGFGEVGAEAQVLAHFGPGALPTTLPYLFIALKIAAPASVITAFVSEYFGGLQNGLGSRIVSNIALSNNAEAWAYVLGACLLGLAFFLAAVALEGVATPGGLGARERDRA